MFSFSLHLRVKSFAVEYLSICITASIQSTALLNRTRTIKAATDITMDYKLALLDRKLRRNQTIWSTWANHESCTPISTKYRTLMISSDRPSTVSAVSVIIVACSNQFYEIVRCDNVHYCRECEKMPAICVVSFGMQHDTPENGCVSRPGETQHVMSPQMTAEASPLIWSQCSRNAITVFLE